jgi:multimeric flavodoxin WrbA
MLNKKEVFILGVNGSPRKDGRVARMLEKVLAAAKKREARVRTIHLVDHKILPHSGRLNQKVYIERTKDDMPALQRLVLEADGIVFATPTHWFNVSSLMKLFLDRLTCLEDYKIGNRNVFLLEGKIAGFVVYSPQGGGASTAAILMMTANQMGMLIPPYGAIFDEGRRGAYDEWITKEYEVLGKNIVQYVNAQRQCKLNWGYPKEKYEISPIELLRKGYQLKNTRRKR